MNRFNFGGLIAQHAISQIQNTTVHALASSFVSRPHYIQHCHCYLRILLTAVFLSNVSLQKEFSFSCEKFFVNILQIGQSICFTARVHADKKSFCKLIECNEKQENIPMLRNWFLKHQHSNYFWFGPANNLQKMFSISMPASNFFANKFISSFKFLFSGYARLKINFLF